MTRRKVSRALTEVWAWKEACYREVAHLPTREAVEKRLEDCTRSETRLHLLPSRAAVHSDWPSAVAEPKAPYGVKKSRRS
ncbi:MAG: hypothetical protein FJ279_05075 [Planctomycetes bacterium]|nr:hypothetical protein [Planctomycetota bacterium]MBM4078194.1 hypothetical protein [Planctomycetota bacterium]